MRASVVVVNRGDRRVERTLDALRGIDDPRLAATIVVDASRGRLDDVRAAHPEVRWIDYVAPEGKPRSIAEQRNVGVAATDGDVVIFLDASCVPEEGWLDALLAPISSGAESIVAGSAMSHRGSSLHDAGLPESACYLEECANMNVAYRREALVAIGPFDGALGYAEDVDYSWRARDLGLRIYFDPAAAVWHDWGGVGENIPRGFRYGVGRARLLRKHRARRGRLLREDRYVTAYALFVLCSPIALFFPWYLVALAIPLVKNRGDHPFEKTAYQLAYGAGAASELLGVPLTKGQRASGSARARRFSARRRRDR